MSNTKLVVKIFREVADAAEACGELSDCRGLRMYLHSRIKELEAEPKKEREKPNYDETYFSIWTIELGIRTPPSVSMNATSPNRGSNSSAPRLMRY